MQIDARELPVVEALKNLKALLPDCCDNSEGLSVLTDKKMHAKQIMAFAEMSGCSAEADFNGEYYSVCISGSSCGCFR